MDLRQLHYFTAVAEEQTISAAARKLHISQPPLSQQIKLLEDELGIRLFDRQPRKVTLTDAGHLLYRHAKNILMLSDEALHEVRDFAQGLHGTLRLGTISSSGSALLERRMLDFCNQYPDVHFELHEGNTFELLRLLEQGVIEIAVVRTPFQTDDVACAYLEEEPMSAVGWPRFFNGNHTRRLALEALTDKPLIIYRRFEQILRTAFSARMLTPISSVSMTMRAPALPGQTPALASLWFRNLLLVKWPGPALAFMNWRSRNSEQGSLQSTSQTAIFLTSLSDF